MAEWSSSYITALPDSAFACIDSKGRHYPHHDTSGKLDLAHLRNALSRLGQGSTTSCGAAHLRAHAEAQGVGKMEPMKAEQIGTAKWRVLALPFGGPLKGGKDTDGEFFSARTDPKPHWFPERPVLFHHGKAELGDDDIGIEDELTKGPDGWWGRLWLDRQHQYFERLEAMIRAGKVYGSSGSIAHLVKTDHKTGEILVWPHAEQTLTFTPANIFSRIEASKAVDDFTTAGIEVPDIENLSSELDSTADLGSDLPEGGEDPAMARLAAAHRYLEEVVKTLR